MSDEVNKQANAYFDLIKVSADLTMARDELEEVLESSGYFSSKDESLHTALQNLRNVIDIIKTRVNGDINFLLDP